jgi:hypothetical protein
MNRLVLILAATFTFLTPAYGGWLDEAVSGTVEDLGRRAVDDAANTAYDGARDKAVEPSGTQGNDVRDVTPPSSRTSRHSPENDVPNLDGNGDIPE